MSSPPSPHQLSRSFFKLLASHHHHNDNHSLPCDLYPHWSHDSYFSMFCPSSLLSSVFRFCCPFVLSGIMFLFYNAPLCPSSFSFFSLFPVAVHPVSFTPHTSLLASLAVLLSGRCSFPLSPPIPPCSSPCLFLLSSSSITTISSCQNSCHALLLLWDQHELLCPLLKVSLRVPSLD